MAVDIVEVNILEAVDEGGIVDSDFVGVGSWELEDVCGVFDKVPAEKPGLMNVRWLPGAVYAAFVFDGL